MKNSKLRFKAFLFVIVILPSVNLKANTILVPQDYPAIQEAIHMADAGDTIIVDEGRYYENINFRSKNLYLTSKFIHDKDTSYIRKTIIDGSKPINPDSASCVYFGAGISAEAILQGFTICGGTGTIILSVGDNPFSFREAGAISIEEASPIIRFNLIKDNLVTNTANLDAIAGGGAIRCRYCDATISNNVIINNKGFHNGGIAIYWSAGTVRNNIIYNNNLSKDFGGAALLIENNTAPTIIENNTIVGNTTSTSGPTGGVYLKNGNIRARNNIIWGNTQKSSKEISGTGTFSLMNNNITTPLGNNGDILQQPDFKDTLLYLSANSPVIDAGYDSIYYEDKQGSIASEAAFPSQGTRQNDMGAYGGPHANILPSFINTSIYTPSRLYMGSISVGESQVKNLTISNLSTHTIEIESVLVKNLPESLETNFTEKIIMAPITSDTLKISWNPNEVASIEGTIEIYHNSANLENPIVVSLTGKSKEDPSSILDVNQKKKINLYIYPNPVIDQANLEFSTISTESVILTIHNTLGSVKKTILNEIKPAGTYSIILNEENFPSGLYYCSLQVGEKILTRQFVIL